MAVLHTFARIGIEHNRPTFWLSKHLGHSLLDVTSRVYGHLEKATRRREAEAMAGVFGVNPKKLEDEDRTP